MPEALQVTFQSRGRSARVWTARFELGSKRDNDLEALRVAYRMNARILASQG